MKRLLHHLYFSLSFSGLLLCLQCKDTDWLSLQLHLRKILDRSASQASLPRWPDQLYYRPRSGPYVCATPREKEKRHNPVFKIHCTWKSCCHSQWKHFELHDAVMSQRLQTQRRRADGQPEKNIQWVKNELCLHFMGCPPQRLKKTDLVRSWASFLFQGWNI